MICKPCGDAGDLSATFGRGDAPALPEIIAAGARLRIEQLHTECPGGNHCDCQHAIRIPAGS